MHGEPPLSGLESLSDRLPGLLGAGTRACTHNRCFVVPVHQHQSRITNQIGYECHDLRGIRGRKARRKTTPCPTFAAERRELAAALQQRQESWTQLVRDLLIRMCQSSEEVKNGGVVVL